MNSKTHGHVDSVFLALVASVVIFGLVALTSASGPLGYADHQDGYWFIKHQLLYGLLPGLVLGTAAFFIPYQFYRKFAFPMLLISVGLLCLVFIPGLGTDLGTFAKSWVQIGDFTFQPSEIVKLTILIYFAAWAEKLGDKIKDMNMGLIPFLSVLCVIAGLMLMQPDLGTLSIIVATCLVVYFVAGAPIGFLAGFGVLGAVLLAFAIKTSERGAERFSTFLHPELDPLGIGYQVNQARLAIGSGGLFGRGYGHSLQKHQYLPEVAGDSIFAVMAEELGFIFTVGFLALYVAMISRGIRIAGNAKDRFGRYLVAGIMSWLGIQALVNIGAMLSLVPLTGVTLPFVSYGGTSLVVTLVAIGIVLNVSKGGAEET